MRTQVSEGDSKLEQWSEAPVLQMEGRPDELVQTGSLDIWRPSLQGWSAYGNLTMPLW